MGDVIAHVSEKPWSAYSAADYTPEQYKTACLVVRGDGSTKEQCKLPVKTPSGSLSRAGVHAAAAALAGARGGVDLTADERASAKKKLIGYYKQLNEDAPASLAHADTTGGTMANTTAAIMALPAPLDPIRLVGDEEKHATLLYFGETSTLPGEAKQTLIDAVELATTMLFPFGEPITGIKRLGNEIPPALVALLAGDNLNQVRNLFIMNPDVNSYQDNVQQHPGFTPHVTLSHPDFTDEAIQRALMQQIYRVRFDRLSVWWNDERFDFDLGPVQGDTTMSEAVDNFAKQFALEDTEHLEHSGTKGMHWGVRKDGGPTDHSVHVSVGRKPHVGDKFSSNGTSHTVVRSVKSPGGGHIVTTRPTAALKAERTARGRQVAHIFMKDKEYWKKAAAVAGVGLTGLAIAAVAPAVVPASALAAGGGAALVSSKIALGTAIATRIGYAHNYVQWARRSGAAKKLAHDALNETRTVGQVWNDMSGDKKKGALLLLDAYSRGEEFYSDEDVQKAWGEMSPVERNVVLFIASSTNPPAKALAHSALDEDHVAVVWVEEGDAEQHGIKGQKWGIRRNTDPATGRVEMTGTTGLKPRTGSADQIQQDRIQKKIDTVGVHALSNTELQAYTRRLQMEKDVKRALQDQSAADKAKADGFIKTFVKKQGGRQTNRVVDKILDVAVEKALEQAGVNLGKKNPGAGQILSEASRRLKPKKGK